MDMLLNWDTWKSGLIRKILKVASQQEIEILIEAELKYLKQTQGQVDVIIPIIEKIISDLSFFSPLKKNFSNGAILKWQKPY
ncbi:MAG: hypothetical protein IPP73_13035 [Chitinophagaceae bacterium]|nr:hypothetical protein [Chitinophagaceae bacterium]